MMTKLLGKAIDGLVDDEIFEDANKLMTLAIEGFERLPPCFLTEGSQKKIKAFNKHYTSQRRTPADELLEAYEKQENPKVTLELYNNLEEHWHVLLDAEI